MKYLDPKKNKNKNDSTWWMEHVDEEDEDLGKGRDHIKVKVTVFCRL